MLVAHLYCSDNFLTLRFLAGSLDATIAENQNLVRHATDLETRVTALEKELEDLKNQREKESRENFKRDEDLAGQATLLATSLSSKFSC